MKTFDALDTQNKTSNTIGHLARHVRILTPGVTDSQIILATIDYLERKGVPPKMADWVVKIANLLSQGEVAGNIPVRLKIADETYQAGMSLISDAAAHAGWSMA
jgi:hypothetical protein